MLIFNLMFFTISFMIRNYSYNHHNEDDHIFRIYRPLILKKYRKKKKKKKMKKLKSNKKKMMIMINGNDNEFFRICSPFRMNKVYISLDLIWIRITLIKNMLHITLYVAIHFIESKVKNSQRRIHWLG